MKKETFTKLQLVFWIMAFIAFSFLLIRGVAGAHERDYRHAHEVGGKLQWHGEDPRPPVPAEEKQSYTFARFCDSGVTPGWKCNPPLVDKTFVGWNYWKLGQWIKDHPTYEITKRDTYDSYCGPWDIVTVSRVGPKQDKDCRWKMRLRIKALERRVKVLEDNQVDWGSGVSKQVEWPIMIYQDNSVLDRDSGLRIMGKQFPFED